ncbi:MAG: InlB B-repeat-containing protein, partial [Candidatus Saccharibacteria bacterium]
MPRYTLNVYKNGAGSGTVTGTGINCGPDCSETYDYGASVTLSASPSSGSYFTGWSGEGCSGTGTCTVSMTQARNVTASFGIITYVLDTGRNGSGSGTISSNPGGINCGADCTERYTPTWVTLYQSASGGSTFAGWSGDCSGTGGCQVYMDRDHNVTATFNSSTPTAALSASPNPVASGDATTLSWSSTNSSSCAVTNGGAAGFSIAGGATSGSDASVGLAGTTTFSISCAGVSGGTATASVTVSVLPRYALTVSKTSTGTGTVTSGPAGISCGGTCSASYVSGTSVTLSQAADANSVFLGWGGACSGTG